MEEDNLNVDIFSIFVKEVFQEVRHRLVGDVTADNNVPEAKSTSAEPTNIVWYWKSTAEDIDLLEDSNWVGNGKWQSFNMHKWDL